MSRNTSVSAPDVTVIVTVHNAMPHLTRCLDSVVGQSIGLERLEVVAVDDGSTDDSGRELDRFAGTYPGTVKVIHQKASTGPAVCGNRALEAATGRYVHFVRPRDHLGGQALERLVARADEDGSDVVAGKAVGTGGRYVHQALYRENATGIGLGDSALPFSLSFTKLFRRELIERHKLRLPENLPVGSDQPFTLEACARARRISVVADDTCYHVGASGDAGPGADRPTRLRCTAQIMDFTAGLLPPGPERDAVLRRYFTWELAKLLQDFPALEPGERREIGAGVARLADAYLTDGVQDAMDVRRRVRVRLAQAGALDELCAAVTLEKTHGAPPLVADGGRVFARHPGFRDPRLGLPDRVYELLGESVSGRLARGTELLASAFEQEGHERLFYTASVRLPVLGELDGAELCLVDGQHPGAEGTFTAGADGTSTTESGTTFTTEPEATFTTEPVATFTTEPTEDGDATVLRARVPVARRTARCGVRVRIRLAGSVHEIPVRGKDRPMPLARQWGGDGPGDRHRVAALWDAKGFVVIDTRPMNVSRKGFSDGFLKFPGIRSRPRVP